jgi:hypothetical protein
VDIGCKPNRLKIAHEHTCALAREKEQLTQVNEAGEGKAKKTK